MRTVLRVKLPATLDHLGRWVGAVSECARDQGFDQKEIGKIGLALEEALVNICNYAYPGEPGDVEVTCKEDHRRFIIEIVDSGIPFDVTSLAAPDLTLNIEERKIGGLGIFLFKKMVDEAEYGREGDLNVLKLIMRREDAM